MDNEKLSYENSRRIKERASEVFIGIRNAAERLCERQHINPYDDIGKEVQRHLYSQLNKKVYDLAEAQGVSIFDVTLQFMPRFSEPIIINNGEHIRFEQVIDLIPIPLELEKGPGYWKGKYYRLKERLQELINNKDD